jgi:enoyl-CoA hydratase
MLPRAAGQQVANAMLLFGQAVDGEGAERCGLAWRCVEDDALLDEARALAGRAASFAPELIRELKATLRDMAGVTSHGDAVERELGPQHWSVQQPDFVRRLESLKRRISRSR